MQLIPRVVAPTVLFFLMPFLFGGRRRAISARGAAVGAAGAALAIATTVAFRAAPLSAEVGGAPVAASAGGEAGDWQACGGTLAGDRFSSLAQITPANVDRAG